MNFTAGTRKRRRRQPSPQEKVDHPNRRRESHLSATATTSPSSGPRFYGAAPTCTRPRNIHRFARQTNNARKGREHRNHQETTDQNPATRGLGLRLSEQERGPCYSRVRVSAERAREGTERGSRSETGSKTRRWRREWSPSSGYRCHSAVPTCTSPRKIHRLTTQTNNVRKG
jgi:hypothetical protein